MMRLKTSTGLCSRVLVANTGAVSNAVPYYSAILLAPSMVVTLSRLSGDCPAEVACVPHLAASRAELQGVLRMAGLHMPCGLQNRPCSLIKWLGMPPGFVGSSFETLALAVLQADLLVCDANDHVTQLAKFLGPVLPKLKSGGWLVLTLKFYGRGDKPADVGDKLTALLPVRRWGFKHT